jgi:hypothetical protein
MRHAFDARVLDAGLFQALKHAIGDGADMAIRPAAGDDHRVGECSLAGEVDGDGVLGLHVFEAVEDQSKRLLRVRTLGDGCGRTTGGGPRSCCGGQGRPFLSFYRSRPGSAGARLANSTPKIGAQGRRIQWFRLLFRKARRAVEDNGDLSPCK